MVPIQAFARRFRFAPIPVEQYPAHLPTSVASALRDEEVIVFACPDEYSDTEAFCSHYGFPPEDCANTLILKYTKDQGEHHAAIVTLGARRLDINGAVKARLGAKRLSLARREVAMDITGMAFGGVTAFGLPAGIKILVDAAVAERAFIVMGAGVRETKLLLAPSTLTRLALVDVAPLTFALP
jgi:prolyl-tRNA editing enzyme YbaK/EbsC (Cys-tRNA(Pro) deacylase)